MIGGMISTTSLDCSPGLKLLAVGFRLTDKADDLWSQRFNSFKSGDKNAVNAGARTLVAALQTLRFASKRRLLLGAISSKDTHLGSATPVNALCRSMAEAFDWEWPQEILSKHPHKSLHTIKSGGSARDAEVSNTYTCAKIGGGTGIAMIVDDFATRGATAGDIQRAFLAANPGWEFRSVTLAKTERIAFWEDKGGISNSHVPEFLAKVWRGK